MDEQEAIQRKETSTTGPAESQDYEFERRDYGLEAALEQFGYSQLTPEGQAVLQSRLFEEYRGIAESSPGEASWAAASANIAREFDLAEGISESEAFGGKLSMKA